jgi:uncharacterized protein (TIGR02594 family)
MKVLPKPYEWVAKEPGPKMLLEALKHYGLLELKGTGSNPDIMKWAKEVGVAGWYTDDSVPWCGLFMGVCALRAGFPYNSELLSSLAWSKWGTFVEKTDAMFGDTLVFVRPGGGHVAFYIAESKENFLIYGGNQGDTVGFTWIAKSRLFAVRRAKWKVSQPENVRKINVSSDGAVLSTNEK